MIQSRAAIEKQRPRGRRPTPPGAENRNIRGGAKKNSQYHHFFRTPPPRGGTAPKKNLPPLCVKKFRNPNFFLKNTTGCFFILCKRSLHNALRTPTIPYFATTNLLALHIPVGPKFSHHKARMLAVGPQEFWLGVKLLEMTFQFFQE